MLQRAPIQTVVDTSLPSPDSLGALLLRHRKEILSRWLGAVKDCSAAMRLSEGAVVDHLPRVLKRIAEAADHIALGNWSAVRLEGAADHAMGRLESGFEIRDVITEFFLLRQVLLEFVAEHRPPPQHLQDAQLVCWAVDAALRESVSAFTQVRHRMLEALDRLSAQALASLSFEELLLRVVETVKESAVDADIACLMLVDGDHLVHRVALGGEVEAHLKVLVPLGAGIAGKVAATRRAMKARCDSDDTAEEAVLRAQGIRALYAVPLLMQGELVGVMQIGSATVDDFPETDGALVRSAADRAGAAINQARLREQAERLAQDRDWLIQQNQIALEAAQMGWWRYDLVTHLTQYDRRCAEIFGETGPGVRPNKELLKQIAPEDFSAVRTAVEAASDPQHPAPYRAEYRIQRPDGTLRWVEAQGLATFDTSEGGRRASALVGVVADITERKLAQEALIHRDRELSEADHHKNEFLATLSHELRNALTPIRNSLYVLAMAPPGGHEARRASGMIDRQVMHLSLLVDDLLDITRIGRGKIRLLIARLNLVEVVQRSVEDHRASLGDHELEVALPQEPIWVEGDSTRLAQVFRNLIQNAIKFTPREGRIAISVRREAGEALVEIADSGIGMDSSTLNKLFAPYSQADRSLQRSKGGLGLGLALVKGLVELHGGRVAAHSDGPWRGSRFTVGLPVRR